MTVAAERGSTVVPVARLFVASPSEPPDLGPVLSSVAAEVVRRPARVGGDGPSDDAAGRLLLSLVARLSRSERCLPVPVELESVGERWRYTIVASPVRTLWTIEEPGTLMRWSGTHLEFDERCATFGPVFW